MRQTSPSPSHRRQRRFSATDRILSRIFQSPQIFRVALIAAGFAAAEILLGFGPGHFIIRERAEPEAFLAFRPWLIVLTVFVSGMRADTFAYRLLAALLFVLAATASEWLVLKLVGTPDAAVMVRSVALSTGLALAASGVAAGFRTLIGNRTLTAFAALTFSAGMLALRPPLPSVMALIENKLRPAPAEVSGRPKALLLTDLPLVWGSGTPEQVVRGDAAPPAAWWNMNRVADVRPVDSIDGKTWDGARLLILAQPRALAPVELVRIDAWVRGGGTALVFTDPQLRWAEALRGAAIRPPARSLLDPLLGHWGVRIDTRPPGWRLLDGKRFGAARLAVIDPGVIAHVPSSCRLVEGLVADCRIGRGRAMIAADADLLSDAAWAGPGGTSRATRTADNGLFIEGVIRSAFGLPLLADPADDVRWMIAPWPGAALLGAGLGLPLLLAAVGLAGRLRRA